MTSRFNAHSTIYGDYVLGMVKEIGGRGGGMFTFKEFAAELGIKPTHNLRKRLRTLERKGMIGISYGLVGKCGTCLIYTIPDNRPLPDSLSDIPF